MGDVIEYSDVVQEVRGAMQPGRLKLQSSGVIFKNIKTGIVEQFSSSDIEEVHWLVRARGHCLKFVLNSGNIHRFDGIRESEFEKLQSFVKKSYSVSLEKKDLSIKGWNWGLAKFTANSLEFEVSGQNAFDIPLGNVSHSITGKNEVTLEFHQNDDAAVSLMELRFHIPADSNPETDSVQEFYNNVVSKADIIQATGESLTIFQEVQCLTPRGRYDIKIYPTFFQLHGKTFDYKIPFTTILRFFLLPHRDNRQMFFVVSLDPPIKQGQTRYPFLIILFNKEDETTLELSISDEDLKDKYDGKLEREMSGPEYEIVSRVMKAVVNKKITVPGTFVGHAGTPSIACSYKAATGFLFPLERGFIFVHKPPIHVRFDEVACVNFARSSGSTRSFDFEIETKAGVTYTFVGMEKDEYGKLYDFVTNKKLRVRNIGGKISGKKRDEAGNYNDDLMDSDDGTPHDAYLERMKREGKERDDDDDDGDSDSSDESFAPPESGSEVAEEFDSDPESTDSEGGEEGEGGEGEGGEKKEKKKKEKKPKSAKTIKEPGMRKKRQPKAEKDPNKPKRPQSSYMLWLADKRETFKEENPGASITDITKIAGEQWKKITESEKKKYEGHAAVAKEKYLVEMEAYKKKLEEEGPPPSPKETKSKKKKTSPKAKKAAPKSPAKGGQQSGSFKSKEYISSSDDSSSEDSDKPLKKKSKKEDKPTKKKSKKDESDEEVPELPSDEEILSSPEASDDSGGGSSSGSGGDDEDDE